MKRNLPMIPFSRWMMLLLTVWGIVPATGQITEERLKEEKINPGQWTAVVELPPGMRWGKPQKPRIAAVWIPEGVEQVRGLFWPGKIIIGEKLATDASVRQALARHNMGVLVLPASGGFISGGGEGATMLQTGLEALGEKTGHPELPHVPFLTLGHSADGLFCRNVGYWKPERTLGVVMVKSGNFHHALEDLDASLKGVPLMHIPGEFEEYGPEGGDMGSGLRSDYVTEPTEGRIRRKNQTQWVMTRMQMLHRRHKEPENLWTLMVERGGRHTTWSRHSTPLFIQYLNSVVNLRLPKGAWDGKSDLLCNPVKASDGWLYDPDIKEPKHEPAPWADYKGDKVLAFWAPDEAFAKALYAYHGEKPWLHPDPTKGLSDHERYFPPPLLRDYIDAPPPLKQEWRGGALTWTPTMTGWKSEGGDGRFDPKKWAIFTGKGGTISIPAPVGSEGLTVGKGYVLDVGTQRVSSRYHGEFPQGSEIRVHLHAKSKADAGKRGSYVNISGNGDFGGRLVVTLEPGLDYGHRARGVLREGLYGIVGVKGRRIGDFSEVVLPEGFTGRWVGGVYCVDVPRVYTAAEQKRMKENLEERYRKVGLVPGLNTEAELLEAEKRPSVDDMLESAGDGLEGLEL